MNDKWRQAERISLTIFLVLFLLWLIGSFPTTWFAIRSPKHAFTIMAMIGGVSFELSDAEADPGLGPHATGWRFDFGSATADLTGGPDSLFSALGLVKINVRIPWDAAVQSGVVASSRIAYTRIIEVPYWLIALIVFVVIYGRHRGHGKISQSSRIE